MRRNEAASWWSRLQSDHDFDVDRKFQIWHADPANAAAFASIERSYGTSALLRLSDPAKMEAAAAVKWPAAARYGFAASIAAIAFTLFALSGRGPFAKTEAVMLATNLGEIRQVGLSDGSKVTLDSGSKVEILVGRADRKALLKSGRARFSVAASARPFIIEAGNTLVIANQGVVDVERANGQSRVDVLAGSAAVHTKGQDGAPDLTLHANEAVASTPDQAPQKLASEADRNWPNGMILFSGTPIRNAVATANLYSDQHILLGNGVGQLRVSGAFHAGDTAGLAKALAACFHFKLTQAPYGNIILSVSGPPAEK